MEEYYLVELQLKACNVTKSNTPPWVFFSRFFLNCTNGTKSRKTSYIYC